MRRWYKGRACLTAILLVVVFGTLVVPGAASSAATATGSVVAIEQSNLSFDIGGQVVSVPVAEGQHVEAGQLLAQVDDSTQQFNLQQADAAVQAAQAILDKLLEPIDSTLISNAEANVKAAQGAYSAKASAVSMDTIKALQLQYQQALSAVDSANKLRANAGGQLSTTDPNYLKFVAQVGLAQNNADIAKLQLQEVQAGTSLESATANIAYAQAQLALVKAGPRQVDIDDAQAQLATAKIMRDQAQHLVDKTRLVAPFAGTLTKVNAKVGEVSTGTAFILTDDSQLYIDVQVAETAIGAIQIGQPVSMTVDALRGANLTGKVLRIDQMANTGASVVTYTVRVTPDHTDAALKVGMTVNASFLLGSTGQGQ